MQSKPGPLPAPPRNAGPRCRRAGRRLAGAPRRPGPQPPDLRGGRPCWRSIRPPPPNNMKCGCDSMFFFCTFSVGNKRRQWQEHIVQRKRMRRNLGFSSNLCGTLFMCDCALVGSFFCVLVLIVVFYCAHVKLF
ncbi:uncharacterized protein LOC123448069 isoform X2 [Hordeum vulgare subsp. vulgare]|uniref:uncharacterized protein LOC123448069 isoform X2 n=1 Tax=Hordeum vulgare subsp. vulgare TaxID=112509 RepID=UPI001D1A3309|nr:uncharacterized protein LOC123448069 isoform X2 [Hordeum vulgare subsp. vulgare]